jgi:MOSC domain-containing protein YiiM
LHRRVFDPYPFSMASIVSLNVSPGGVPKLPIAQARVTGRGMEGDRQAHRQVHGGPDRALCIFAMEEIEAMQADGHPIVPGSIGENVTVRGLDWSKVEPGVRLRLGEVEVYITKFTTPCKQIREAFADHDYRRVSQDHCPGRSRVYARVMKPGTLHVGDEVEVVSPR